MHITPEFINTEFQLGKLKPFTILKFGIERETERGNEFECECSDGLVRVLILHFSSLGIKWVWAEDYEDFTHSLKLEFAFRDYVVNRLIKESKRRTESE